MQIQKITLADGLKHHKYNWPLTLLSYPIELEAKNPKTSVFQLIDEDGKKIPFQIGDVNKSSDEGVSAKL